MGSALTMLTTFAADDLRLATRPKDVRQIRRLQSLAAAAGMCREEFARFGGMGRQPLR